LRNKLRIKCRSTVSALRTFQPAPLNRLLICTYHQALARGRAPLEGALGPLEGVVIFLDLVAAVVEFDVEVDAAG